MSHYKTMTAILFGLVMTISNVSRANCTSIVIHKKMDDVLFHYFQATSAIDNNSLPHFQEAANELWNNVNTFDTDFRDEIRGPSSINNECHSIQTAVAKSVSQLKGAQTISEAKMKITDLKQVLAMWTYLER